MFMVDRFKSYLRLQVSLNEALWLSKFDLAIRMLGKKYGVEITARVKQNVFANSLLIMSQIVGSDWVVYYHTYSIKETDLRRSNPTEHIQSHYVKSINNYLWRKFTDAGAVCDIMEE